MTPLDRIELVEPGVRAKAVRHVTHTWDVFDTHFPRFPVLPGVYLLDDLAAVAALALDGRWTLASASRIKFRHFVQPGDALELEAQLTGTDATGMTFKATARVDGRPVATVRALRLVPVSEEQQ